MEPESVTPLSHQLTLQWVENGQPHSQTLYRGQASKSPSGIRIGRDPARCDIVLQHPTVSGLHVEIGFAPQGEIYLRNLRDSNPPKVDGQRLYQGDRPLYPGSQIVLGQVTLQVTAAQAAVAPIHPAGNSAGAAPQDVYGLCCPNCQRHCAYEQAKLGCPWCGTSLAGANSILLSSR